MPFEVGQLNPSAGPKGDTQLGRGRAGHPGYVACLRASEPALTNSPSLTAALVPPPTFYHQSLLSAALASTPSLLRPQALLVSALAPTSSPPSAALWSLLLPYSALLSISDTPSAATSRLLDLLISTDTRIPALVDLATRLLGSSVLPASAAEQATALYAALNAVPRPDSYTIDLKAIVERAVAQLVAIGGGVGLLPAAPLDSATAVRGGLEERVLGALETDVQSMMKDPSDAAGSEPGAEQAQSSRRLAEIILDALVRRVAAMCAGRASF